MMFIKSRVLERKQDWDLSRYSRFSKELHGDMKKQDELDEKINEAIRLSSNEDYCRDELRGLHNVESVLYSVQGKSNRIVPISLTMSSGEVFGIANFDRCGNYLDYEGSRAISYKVRGGQPWNRFSWLALTDEDIRALPGYKEFAKDFVDKDGRKHVTWDNVSHVVWENFTNDKFILPYEIYLKDGTRLTMFMSSNLDHTMRFEDDGDRYALTLNLSSSFDFPCYKDFMRRRENGSIEPYEIIENIPVKPLGPRIFSFDYMERRNYMPDVVRKTREGKYIVSCPLSDLTEESRKNALDKGVKSDSAGRILISLSHDMIVGEVARHLEVGTIKGNVDLDKLAQSDYDGKNDVLFNEVVSSAARVARSDILTKDRRPPENFLEEGYHDRLVTYRSNMTDPFSMEMSKEEAERFVEEIYAEWDRQKKEAQEKKNN